MSRVLRSTSVFDENRGAGLVKKATTRTTRRALSNITNNKKSTRSSKDSRLTKVKSSNYGVTRTRTTKAAASKASLPTRRRRSLRLASKPGSTKPTVSKVAIVPSRRSWQEQRQSVMDVETNIHDNDEDMGVQEEDVTETGMDVEMASATPKAVPAKVDAPIAVPTPDVHEIDFPDLEDEFMVAEYIDDIMKHLKKMEAKYHPAPHYLDRQPDLTAKMREILIDWLVEVHIKFKLRRETLYLTVNFIDRFLGQKQISRRKLQLVGCTAMLLASKYEEIWAPEVKDFVYISDQAYKGREILGLEGIMLATLNFNLTVPSMHRFSQRYVKVANGGAKLWHLVNFLCEMTLQRVEFLQYLPSKMSATAVHLGQLMLGVSPAWSPLMVEQTGYTVDDLTSCLRDMHFLLTHPHPKYRAVRRKYASKKFESVSRLPADHLVF